MGHPSVVKKERRYDDEVDLVCEPFIDVDGRRPLDSFDCWFSIEDAGVVQQSNEHNNSTWLKVNTEIKRERKSIAANRSSSIKKKSIDLNFLHPLGRCPPFSLGVPFISLPYRPRQSNKTEMSAPSSSSGFRKPAAMDGGFQHHSKKISKL